ncbi:polycomb group RING finger protein 3 [Tetranychus urticae]|uniref:RING-type domain-containing protein n=1 Tax=Tetranychus urticae TaxID=32264 RepID=T1L376_TETUR|nr:polycomb group RING finger protein 3 [Tetranychus urticae]
MVERLISLKYLNPHITCNICKGYLIDATTVTECLHTFCKSCLVKHLEERNTCPSCHLIIHQSHPLNYIAYDRTMQDIVYKLVPNLQLNEQKREREFYRKRGLPYPKANSNSYSNSNDKDVYKYQNESNTNEENSDYHRSDEQVNILLESQSGCNLKQMKRKYIRCSSHATVTHLKKFVAKKLFNNFEKYKEIDILCNDELLGKDHTLKFVWVTRWRYKDPPLRLSYRPKIDF